MLSNFRGSHSVAHPFIILRQKKKKRLQCMRYRLWAITIFVQDININRGCTGYVTSSSNRRKLLKCCVQDHRGKVPFVIFCICISAGVFFFVSVCCMFVRRLVFAVCLLAAHLSTCIRFLECAKLPYKAFLWIRMRGQNFFKKWKLRRVLHEEKSVSRYKVWFFYTRKRNIGGIVLQAFMLSFMRFLVGYVPPVTQLKKQNTRNPEL